MLEFSRPIWLLLLLALPVIWWLAIKLSFASLGPYQKWISLAIRTLVWLLLVFSLAGVQFVRMSDRVSVVVVRDSSDSVEDSEVVPVMDELEKARETMHKDDSLGKVNFGADAYLEFLPQHGVDKKMLDEWQTNPRGNFTNLSSAIQLAVASFPDNAQKRLVLVTDGNENIGNALAESRVARDNGVELYVVPLANRTGPEVVLSSIEAPAHASLGQTVNVRFVVDSTVATPADVSLIRNGQFVGKVPIDVRPGKEAYEFPVRVDQSGFFTYELVIEPKLDTVAENNRNYAFSLVSGRSRILYATGTPEEAAYLPQTLKDHSFTVDVVTPGQIPYNMADFQVYDGIIFSDVAAYDVTDQQMKMIQSLVRDFGRGFLMIGGEKSFGPGGYYDTPIEETLPVDMDFRRKKITPSTLVVCMIDKSGSMGATVGGVTKVAMAKEACKDVVKLQQPDDYVGVMGFDAVGQWVVEPTKGINKNQTLEQISSMQAGGGTDLFPALKAAWEASKNVPVQVKHFIVFTDGLVAPADFQGLVDDMVNDNCTISTVAFGTDADIPFMQWLADQGQGNMYKANSLYDLPKIFTREVFLANKATLTEEPFYAVPTENNPLVNSIPWNTAPFLHGYVATSLKDDADEPLVTHKDDPLLADWRYGLGKSAAFTSDAKNRWARDWLNWPGYEKFWTGIGRWIKSDLDTSGMDISTSVSGGEGVIKVNAVGKGGDFVNYEQIQAHITDPELNSQEVNLTQTAPGQYEAHFPVKENGNYFINVVQMKDDGTGKAVPAAAQATGFSVAYSPEYRDLKPNTFMLNQLAAGSLAPEGVPLSGLFTDKRKPTRRLEEAWELFTLIALLLWLLDVAVRRLAFDWQEMKLAIAAVTAGAGGRRATRVRESLADLLTAKGRAAEQMSKPTPVVRPRAAKRQEEVLADKQEIPQPAPRPTSAPRAVPDSSSAGLSDLRERLKRTESRPQQAPPKFTPEIPAQPSKAQEQKKDERKDMSTRDFTSELLKKKRDRERGGD